MSTRGVLVVLDGSEIIRQRHADSMAYLSEIESQPYLAQREVFFHTVLDAQASHALAGVQPSDYECIIFTSNALIRPDGPIMQALKDRGEDLENYIAEGGNILLFHQSFAESVTALSVGGPHRHEWHARADYSEPLNATAVDPNHPVLNHPNRLKPGRFAEDSQQEWLNAFPLCYQWLGLSASSSFTSIVEVEGQGALLAVSSATNQGRGGRVLICTPPADWARDTDLLVNLLAYLLDGLPAVLVLREESSNLPALATLTVARIGGRAPVSVVPVRRDGTEYRFAEEHVYLLQRSRLCLAFENVDLEVLAQSTQIRSFLAEGGSLAGLSSGGEGVQQLVAHIGGAALTDHAEAIVSEALLLDIEQWISEALVFDIRDVWVAATEAQRFDPTTAVFGDTGLAQLERRCTRWLQIGQAAKDPMTAAVVLWLLLFAVGAPLRREHRELLDAISDVLPLEGTVLEGAIRAVHIDEPMPWEKLVARIDEEGLSLAGTVRLLDALRMNAAAGLDVDSVLPPGDVAVQLGDRLSASVMAQRPDARTGWISEDATAAIVGGFASLGRSVLRSDAGLGLVVAATGPLLTMVNRSSNHAPSLTSIRLGAAQLALEAAFPVVGQVAALRLSGTESNAAERSSADERRIAELQRALQDSRERFAESQGQCEVLNSQVRELRDDAVSDLRMSIYLGRVMWVLAVLGLALIAGFLTVTAVGLFIGPDSGDTSTQMQSIASLIALLAVLAATVRFGIKHHLLPQRLVLEPRDD